MTVISICFALVGRCHERAISSPRSSVREDLYRTTIARNFRAFRNVCSATTVVVTATNCALSGHTFHRRREQGGARETKKLTKRLVEKTKLSIVFVACSFSSRVATTFVSRHLPALARNDARKHVCVCLALLSTYQNADGITTVRARVTQPRLVPCLFFSTFSYREYPSTFTERNYSNCWSKRQTSFFLSQAV